MSTRIGVRTRTFILADGTEIPIVDARINLPISPTTEDIKNATRGDPDLCMYAQWCYRELHSEVARIGRKYAYIDIVHKGKRELQRFRLTEPARSNIIKHDAYQDLQPETVVFERPRPYETLKALEHRRRAKRPAAKGSIQGKAPRKPRRKMPQGLIAMLRSTARGMSDFREHAS